MVFDFPLKFVNDFFECPLTVGEYRVGADFPGWIRTSPGNVLETWKVKTHRKKTTRLTSRSLKVRQVGF